MGKNDLHKAGRSTSVPFIEGEGYKARHQRRLEAAKNEMTAIWNGDISIGWDFEVKNDAHHWIMTKPNTKWRIEWWPSSAKLVVNQSWSSGIHVHDIDQMLNILKNINDNLPIMNKRLEQS